MKLQTGFSLIELLVSLFLGSLLMIMLVKLYFSFRETAQWQDTQQPFKNANGLVHIS